MDWNFDEIIEIIIDRYWNNYWGNDLQSELRETYLDEKKNA